MDAPKRTDERFNAYPFPHPRPFRRTIWAPGADHSKIETNKPETLTSWAFVHVASATVTAAKKTRAEKAAAMDESAALEKLSDLAGTLGIQVLFIHNTHKKLNRISGVSLGDGWVTLDAHGWRVVCPLPK